MHKYIVLNKPNASPYTLRKGFYLIVDYKKITSNDRDKILALAIYSETTSFNRVFVVDVHLHQLKNYKSKSPAKSLSYDALVNNIIEVEEVILIQEKYKSYQIIWDFVGGGEEVINHFRLVEKQQYRILAEIAFEDWLEEEYEQLYFDELMKEEFMLKQSSKDWLDEELEQLYFDQLMQQEAELSHEHDLIHDELNAELENNEDGLLLDEADINSQNDEGHSENGSEDIFDSNI